MAASGKGKVVGICGSRTYLEMDFIYGCYGIVADYGGRF
jgi:hypothetical protein